MSALSHRQKFYLVGLAQRAFNLRGAELKGRLTGANRENGEFRSVSSVTSCSNRDLQSDLDALCANGSAACFITWRHEQVALACGKLGLRLCDQLDYKKVEGHFLHLLGEDGRAMNAEVRAQTEPRRQAEALVVAACTRWGFRISYADAICRQIFKVSLDEASTDVLRKVLYTLNNRGAQRKRRQLEVA